MTCPKPPVKLYIYDAPDSIPMPSLQSLLHINPASKHTQCGAFLDLAERSSYRTQDPAAADFFIVPANLEQLNKQEGGNTSTLTAWEAAMVAIMRTTGHFWDANRSRHIICWRQCPAPVWSQLGGTHLNSTFPLLGNGTIKMCLHAHAQQFQRRESLHLPYYVAPTFATHGIGEEERSILSVLAGTVDAKYAQQAAKMRPVLEAKMSRDARYKLLIVSKANHVHAPGRSFHAQLEALLVKAKFQFVPPGDTMERAARDQSIAAGTVPVVFDVPGTLRYRHPLSEALKWESFTLVFKVSYAELRSFRIGGSGADDFWARLNQTVTQAAADGRWLRWRANLKVARRLLEWTECGVFRLAMLELCQAHGLSGCHRAVDDTCLTAIRTCDH